MHWIDAVPAAKSVAAGVAVAAWIVLAICARRRRASDDGSARQNTNAARLGTLTRWAKVVPSTAQIAGWLLTIVGWLHSAGLL